MILLSVTLNFEQQVLARIGVGEAVTYREVRYKNSHSSRT